MEREITLVPARKEDIDACAQIIENAKQFQREQGFVQWTDSYPNRDTVCEDVSLGWGYRLLVDGYLAGYMCVHCDGEPAYDKIQGAWKTKEPYGVMHRMAIAREFRGQGLTNTVFALIEELCKSRGIHGLRVDTDFHNKRMQHVFEKCGFTYRGEIELDGRKLAYDKIF